MTCPSAEQWRAFLDSDLSEDEQAALNGHLESCDECPKLLESLAAGKETWMGTAEQLAAGEKAGDPANSGRLRDVMDELKNSDLDAPRTVSPESLTFLTPSENEEAIGQLGHYEVLEIIGAGGMGVVLKAWDPSLRRIVAIKILASHLANSSSAWRRFVREARAAAAVTHDHVVAIHAVDAESEPPFLVMHYVEGRTLQMRIDQDGPLELREVLRIGEQTARGLAAAHEQGIIHRDIKPSNILLENGVERVRITDFGLARAVDDASMTQSGVLAGTPLFMAPEQAQGESLDHRADLFSLGSLLYAMCTGRSPFRSSTIMGVIRRVCEDAPRPIREINPDVPDWFCAIVDRLLSKKREDRFQSAEEVASLLADCLAHVQQPLTIPLPGRLVTIENETARSNEVFGARPAEAAVSVSTGAPQDPATSAETLSSSDVIERAPKEPLDGVAIAAAQEKLLRSGRLLKWAGILNFCLLLLFVVYVAITEQRELDDIAPFTAVGLLLAGAIYYGGRRLENGDSEGWPALAALLCYLFPPGWVYSLRAAFSTQATLRDPDVQQMLIASKERGAVSHAGVSGRTLLRQIGMIWLAMVCTLRFWICFVPFLVLVALLVIDLSTYHFDPTIASLIVPVGMGGALIQMTIFGMAIWRGRNRDLTQHNSNLPRGPILTALILSIAQGYLTGYWIDESANMGFVHARISTPGAVISLRRPNGGIELMFGTENTQTVRIPAGPWEWSVHLGAAGPLMSERLELVRSGVTILEPQIPRGRDVIPGEYSIIRTERRATQNPKPNWLRPPERVVIQDGKLTFHFDDETSQTWLAAFDTTKAVPLNRIQLTVDLHDPESKAILAIGTYSVSESEVELRLSPPEEVRPIKNGFNQFGQQALTTFHLRRMPTLKSLHGAWKPVVEKSEGREVRGAGHFTRNLAVDRIDWGERGLDVLNYVWEFSGETLTSRVADKEFMSGKVLLYDSGNHPRLLWMFNGPAQRLEWTEQKMIYRLRRDGEGEILEVAFQVPASDFPAEMESTPENRQAWIRFRRLE